MFNKKRIEILEMKNDILERFNAYLLDRLNKLAAKVEDIENVVDTLLEDDECEGCTCAECKKNDAVDLSTLADKLKKLNFVENNSDVPVVSFNFALDDEIGKIAINCALNAAIERIEQIAGLEIEEFNSIVKAIESVRGDLK